MSNIEQIKQINIIPKNEEIYIADYFNSLKFVDILSVMNLDDRLYKLTNSLGNNDACDTKEFQTNKKYFLKEYPFMTDDDFK